MKHVLKPMKWDSGEYGGTCSCRGWSSTSCPDRKAVEDEHYKHLQNVERARAGQRKYQPGLDDQRDWFQQQADDTRNTRKDRDLWQQLADELSHRIGDAGAADEEQLRLL